MKATTKMSRLTGELEKMFRCLNTDFFDNQLPTPVITVTPSARSYAHYTPYNAWETKGTPRREINIASGTLDRPLEDIVASLVHEMCHMLNDVILNVQDTSRSGTFHNKEFAKTAMSHGLNCERTEKYGFSYTSPADDLLEWVLLHDEFREIEMCRTSSSTPQTTGIHTADRHTTDTYTASKSNSRRYVCPTCGTIVRATKEVRIICADCMQLMTES